MAKIWILTKGDYSEYHIIGAFDDEACARAIAAKDKGMCVEEYELNERSCLMDRDYLVWDVDFVQNGDVGSIRGKFISCREGYDTDPPAVCRGFQGGIGVYGFRAKTEAEAIKIASEHRRKKLAE